MPYNKTNQAKIQKSPYVRPPRTRKHQPCYCQACKGKLTDPRTKATHTEEIIIPQRETTINFSEAPEIPFNDLMPPDPENDINDNEGPQEEIHSFLVKRTPIAFQKNRTSKTSLPEVVDELFSDDDRDGASDEEDYERNFRDNTLEYLSDDDLEEDQVNFDAPEIELEENNSRHAGGLENTFSWIIIWILKYQERFRLSNVATNALFQFLHYVLINIDETKFATFPTSLYMAQKDLGICVHLVKYAACEKCCKLYNISDVSSSHPSITPKFTNCIFQDFPNHPMSNKRNACGAPLYKQVRTMNGVIKKPALIFPMVSLKHQLNLLFKRKGFEESCRKCVNRPSDPEILADIYDGRVWKSFNDENGTTFFRPDTADTHLGIMLNMDWFQPFENSQYSTGAIYAIICNLPRNERFKPSNILTLALIPGPKEPALHHLNHYLAPLVDQLIKLWNGVNLETFEHSSGKTIRGAIICCSCDIPAARKLCGYISARIACHRCLKYANFDDRNQPNFGGMADMDSWFVERDVEEIKINALEWKNCKSEEQRRKHVSETFVRWSEIHRLPNFNPVRFLIVDPMHCLFLGIAKWIIMRLWIEEGKLNSENLSLMQKRASRIQVPVDIGRLPNKISMEEGFSGFTADQWKTFIMVYATSITWDLLKEPDQRILANFVRTCNILVCRIVSISDLQEAHQRLINLVKEIEKEYGPKKITPNLHLCLHLCECSLDYGPLYAFWCYSMERMNGLLGNLII